MNQVLKLRRQHVHLNNAIYLIYEQAQFILVVIVEQKFDLNEVFKHVEYSRELYRST